MGRTFAVFVVGIAVALGCVVAGASSLPGRFPDKADGALHTGLVPPERAANASRWVEAAGRQAGVVARDGARLYVADEDRQLLHALELPDASQTSLTSHRTAPLPGAPAAVLAHAGQLLVAIRDPGMLLWLEDDGEQIVQLGSAALPDDAWGMTLTADGRAVLVSSAWSAQISLVALEDMSLRWSVAVAREPRAIAVLPGGERAYVSHLVGAALTRIDGLSGTPDVARVAFPAAPLRNPGDENAETRAEAASLAYAAVLSPDASRLFVPRHALGATGKLAWNGQPTVDVLLTGDETPLAERGGSAPLSRMNAPLARRDSEITGVGPIQARPVFAQPRHAVYRKRSDTLLVASEGRDMLVELDAKSVDPSAHPLRSYALHPWADFSPLDDEEAGATACGAPSGIALSDDEATAYVFCRSTATLAVVTLRDDEGPHSDAVWSESKPHLGITRIPLADDPLDAEAALGRRLFYDAVDNRMSFGFACAGCHPEGRDDGHVWQEIGTGVMRGFPEPQAWTEVRMRGEARQTPMLAGRVHHDGPYGWRGESATLEERIIKGFAIHHWWPNPWIDKGTRTRAHALAAFLRQGLVTPPRRSASLTLLEERGREVFHDATAGCASCHVDGFSDLRRVDLDLRAPDPRFLGRERARYRTPMLSFVAGTAPYLHDGSAPSLEALLEHNHDRMGITSQLDAEDREALVAFLRSLDGPPATPPMPLIRPEPRRATPAPFGPEPKPAEWADAPAIALARANDSCDAQRVREWVRVRCRVHASEAQLVGGAPEGVRLAHSERYVRPRDPRFWWGSAELVDDVIAIFPTRPGDRRLIQALRSRFVQWGGVDLDAALVISESWLDGEAQPTITVH